MIKSVAEILPDENDLNTNIKASVVVGEDEIVSRIRHALCGDGVRRTLYFRKKVKKFKSAPAYTYIRGKTVWGEVTNNKDDMIFMASGKNAHLANG